jgi:hypothetical protein
MAIESGRGFDQIANANRPEIEFCSVNRPIVTSPKRGAKRLKRQVDWLVNGSLTGPIFSHALNQLTQLEIFPARDQDWPVNERERLFHQLRATILLPIAY